MPRGKFAEITNIIHGAQAGQPHVWSYMRFRIYQRASQFQCISLFIHPSLSFLEHPISKIHLNPPPHPLCIPPLHLMTKSHPPVGLITLRCKLRLPSLHHHHHQARIVTSWELNPAPQPMAVGVSKYSPRDTKPGL